MTEIWGECHIHEGKTIPDLHEFQEQQESWDNYLSSKRAIKCARNLTEINQRMDKNKNLHEMTFRMIDAIKNGQLDEALELLKLFNE